MKSETGGLDWIRVSFWVRHEDWPRLKAVLAAAQQAAREETRPGLGGLCELGPGVAGIVGKGGRSGGVFHRYLVQIDGMNFGFGDFDEDGQKPTPNVIVDVPGLACLVSGAAWCLKRMDEVLQAVGATIIRETVSHLDVCADVTTASMEDVEGSLAAGRIICRARETSSHGNLHETSQTRTIGARTGLNVTFYDKLKEVQKQPEKFAAMVRRRWGGEVPDKALRVEFKLGRDQLKELGILERRDLAEKLPAAVAYLVEKWIRFTADDVDRTHTTREKLAAWWVRVQEAFKAWLPTWAEATERVQLPPERRPDLEKQAVGCIASSLANAGIWPRTRKQLMKCLEVVFGDLVDYFEQRLEERAVERGVRQGQYAGMQVFDRWKRVWRGNAVWIEKDSPATWGFAEG